jgi:formate hydrogenlyase subunit 6/NADH:ubiquinone oxidoreductase subunit I
MQLKPYEYKSDIMSDGDCIKCNSCVAACPINALEFKKKIKKAA